MRLVLKGYYVILDAADVKRYFCGNIHNPLLSGKRSRAVMYKQEKNADWTCYLLNKLGGDLYRTIPFFEECDNAYL